MEENIFYHIHKVGECFNDKQWYEGAIINIGNEYNFFYKFCTEFEAKYSTYYDKDNEPVNNVPWQKVYKYLLSNNMLNFDKAYGLLESANHIISEYQMLLRENAYEEIRKEFFNHLPSRTSCIWLCKEKQLKFWLKQFKGRNCKIFMVKVFGKPFKSNNNLLVGPSDSYNHMKEMAQKYWAYNAKEEDEKDEYLYVGKIKVIKEISPDKFLNVICKTTS